MGILFSSVSLQSLALLFTITLPKFKCYIITESISDTISAGAINHYTIESMHPIIVAVISEEGDTDIYASPTHKNTKPSSENYEVISASCGMEVLLLVMNSEVRKYTVGLYGHIRYTKSKYKLVVIEPNEEDIKRYQVCVNLCILLGYLFITFIHNTSSV